MSPLNSIDPQLWYIFSGVMGTLMLVTGAGLVLQRQAGGATARVVVTDMNTRVRAWWVMCVLFSFSVVTGVAGSAVFFGCLSFLALREFVTMIPTRRADHRVLVGAFYGVIPLQYWLAASGSREWFGLLIPVVAMLAVPISSAIAGDTERFLERIATLEWALMICVYCVSHVPALLALPIPGYAGRNLNLLVFFVTVAEASDALQYAWGKWLGTRPIAPRVSPGKTWEGFLGGAGSATVIGGALWWITPFTPWQAAGIALVITLMGFAGGLVLSAVKRDRGIKDYGTLISGHGGVLDRIDSMCFAAPVFFHLVKHGVA